MREKPKMKMSSLLTSRINDSGLHVWWIPPQDVRTAFEFDTKTLIGIASPVSDFLHCRNYSWLMKSGKKSWEFLKIFKWQLGWKCDSKDSDIFNIKCKCRVISSNFMVFQTVSTKKSLKQNTKNYSHFEPCCTLWPLKRQLSSKSRLFSLHEMFKNSGSGILDLILIISIISRFWIPQGSLPLSEGRLLA